jgi:hypothetical protein
MSTDPIGAAFGRDDAAIAACAPQIAAEPAYELTGIAMAIERVEALLAACGPAPENSDAIERIADIAFVLHERDVEASLCDALDAAVRELSNVNAVKQTNVQHVRQAAELVRELSHRVADMIVLLQASLPPAANATAVTEDAPGEPVPATAEQPASEDALDGEIPRQGLFAAELLKDDEFARAVAELAASLPAPTDPVEASPETQHEAAGLTARELALAPEPDAAIAEAQREPVDFGADELALAPEPDAAIAEAQREPVDFGADELALAPEPDAAIAEAQREPVDFGTDEPALAPEPDAAIAEAQREPVDFAAGEPALAPEPDAAIAEAQREPVDFGADEPALTPEPAEAISETRGRPADLATGESARAPEPVETNLETPDEPAALGATEPAIAPAPAEAIAETQVEPADLAPDDAPVAAEQEPPSITEIASEQPSHEDARPAPGALLEEPADEEISKATLLSKGTLSETLAGEVPLENADAVALPTDLPGDPPDHSFASEYAAAAPPNADEPHVPTETLSPLTPEAAPECETALAPGTSAVAHSTEPDLQSLGETPAPLGDVAAEIIAEQPSDQIMARHNGGDGPVQIAGEASRQNADDAVAGTAIDVSEEPPRRVTESSQSLLPELALVDPQDDPGDLFEPLAGAAAPIAGTIRASNVPPQAHSATAAADPLAAMRALSAEELLALFT